MSSNIFMIFEFVLKNVFLMEHIQCPAQSDDFIQWASFLICFQVGLCMGWAAQSYQEKEPKGRMKERSAYDLWAPLRFW